MQPFLAKQKEAYYQKSHIIGKTLAKMVKNSQSIKRANKARKEEYGWFWTLISNKGFNVKESLQDFSQLCS